MASDQANTEAGEVGPVTGWVAALREALAQRMGLVRDERLVDRRGRVVRVQGGVVTATGLPVPAGARCLVQGYGGDWLPADVVGFDASVLRLIPHRGTRGIARGAVVRQVEREPMPAVGWGLLGRVLDGEGQPLDGYALPELTHRWPLLGRPINPLERQPVTDILDCGVRSINALTTLGRGMRVGLFAGSGVGKSTLLGMMARHVRADVVVVALIGERGREVGEFIRDTLGAAALQRAVIVAAPADTSALARLHAAHLASAVAEFFRHEGQHVVLLVDSLTRLAMAGREVGLAAGEPPVMRAYPPSTFSLIASYLERAGPGRAGEGSITGLYTVLVEGDDPIADPVADTARATLDGHIVLSRTIADSGLYPPIDPESSLSRVMDTIVGARHQQLALRFRSLWARLQRKRDLLDIGAYRPGSDTVLDTAISKQDAMTNLLRQALTDDCNCQQSLLALEAVAGAEEVRDVAFKV